MKLPWLYKNSKAETTVEPAYKDHTNTLYHRINASGAEAHDEPLTRLNFTDTYNMNSQVQILTISFRYMNFTMDESQKSGGAFIWARSVVICSDV